MNRPWRRFQNGITRVLPTSNDHIGCDKERLKEPKNTFAQTYNRRDNISLVSDDGGWKMLVKRLDELETIVALDDTVVREMLNPKHELQILHLGYSLAHATLPPAKTSLPHRFKSASEVYYILKGKGLIHIDDESENVGPGDTVYIPPRAVQSIENTGESNLEFLCIVYPEWQPDAEELV